MSASSRRNKCEGETGRTEIMKGKKHTQRKRRYETLGQKKTATRSVWMMSRVGGCTQRKARFKIEKERKIEGEKRKKEKKNWFNEGN